jgi:hypothetical protein
MARSTNVRLVSLRVASSVPGMEVVVPLVSAFLGVSVAFFLSIGVYDLVPDAWLRGRGARTRITLDALAAARHPLIPRTIHQTALD